MTSLRLEHVSKSFRGITAVQEFSLEVRGGTVTALVGPNGSGKTTVFDLVSGFLRPDCGSIHLNDKRIDGLTPHAIARLGVGRTFQSIRLCWHMSVQENVMLGVARSSAETLLSAIGRFRVIRRENTALSAAVRELLSAVDLTSKEFTPANQLSHGQRRLVEAARVLAMDASVVLMDEPMSGLSPVMAKTMATIVSGLRDEGAAVIGIEHNVGPLLAVADRVVVMHEGRMLAEGSPKAVQANPAVVDAYFGDGWFHDSQSTGD